MDSGPNYPIPAKDQKHASSSTDQPIRQISQLTSNLSLHQSTSYPADNEDRQPANHPTHRELIDNQSNQPYPHQADQDLDPTERLPSYDELKEKEGHRFGRWKGWIEKRAQERMEERVIGRQEAKSRGRSFGTGWDLPSPNQTTEAQLHSTVLNRNSSIISSRDERAAFRSATRNHKDAFAKHTKGRSEGSSHHRLNLESAPGAINLTPSTSIHPIGSRFLPQFPSQPLCAILLPLSQHPTATSPPVERFLLVGTIDGLYVCDLIPSLSSTVKKNLVSPTDSKVYQIWQGLAIHQLEIAIEDPLHSSESFNTSSRPTALSGIVIALTSSSAESTSVSLDGITKLIKMWPLQSIINLVKFRAFSEHSECLDLTEESPVSKRDSTLAIGTSALAGLKSMFEKGKHKAETSISSLSDLRQPALSPRATGASNRSVSSSFSTPKHQHSSGPSLNSSLASSTPLCKSSNPSHLELPLQWAKQTISLNLPRIQANGPILFIKFSNSPTQGLNPINDQFDRNIRSLSTPIALRPRSYAGPDADDADNSSYSAPQNDGWWYLIIATKQLIFIMESQPAPQRIWHLCAEMSAPFTAKTAKLVLSEFPKSHFNRSPSSSRSLRGSRRLNNHRPGVGELSVLLTMKEYAVVISLSDLSVQELDLEGALVASQTTTSLSTCGPTLKPTGGSFSGLDHLDRIQNNLMPFARNLPSIGGSVEPMLAKKRIKDGGGVGINEGFQVENRRLTSSVHDRRWAGCEELLIPVPSPSPVDPNAHQAAGGGATHDATESHHNLRVVYLITRGYFTHAVMCPFGYKTRPRSSQRNSLNLSVDQCGGISGGIPPPLLLKPFHTFTWRAIPVKVYARIIPTPSKWKKHAKKQGPRESAGGFPFSPPHQNKDEDDSKSNEEVFCCLTAFTASSIEVQEGFISLKFLRTMWEMGKKRKSDGNRYPPISFFTPASSRSRHRFRQISSSASSLSSMGSETHDYDDDFNLSTSTSSSIDHFKTSPSLLENLVDQDDSNDQSSYDYSAKIGYLCSSANWFPSSSSATTNPTRNWSCRYQAAPNFSSNPHLERNPDSFDSVDSTVTLSNINSNDQNNLHDLDHDGAEIINRDSSTQGSFFWKQSVGEWKIMYVCNSMDS